MLRFFLLLSNATLPIAVIATRFGIFWLCVMTACAHALLLYAIMHPRCSWLCPLVSSFTTDRREVWLTIDDGPDPLQTRELAQALQSRGVRATFFLIGEKLATYPELAAELINCSHSIGLHTQTHPQWHFWCARQTRIRREIEANILTLKQSGFSTNLFRSPVGHKPPALARVLSSLELQFISWSASGWDGFESTPKQILQRVIRKVQPGGIILLHQDRPQSVQSILLVVDTLLGQSYRFATPTPSRLTQTKNERGHDVAGLNVRF